MNAQLKAKIEVAILGAMINGMECYKGTLTEAESLRRKDILVKDLYNDFASYEPKHEEEVV